MTYNEFIELIKHPEKISEVHFADLKELVALYPYFVPARLFLLRSMQLCNHMHFVAELKLTSIYCSNRRWLYYYLHPEKTLSTEPYRKDKIGKSAGDYFGMMNAIESEGGDTQKSLKSLALGLKSAREMLTNVSAKPLAEEPSKQEGLSMGAVQESEIRKQNNRVQVHLPDTTYFLTTDFEISESSYKNLISQKKYTEAIGILRQLNLNNPKKSVYFADQIRFLEKVIENSKR